MPSILSLFRSDFNKINNTGARMLDSIYFILSSEISAYQKQIEVISITSEMICYQSQVIDISLYFH